MDEVERYHLKTLKLALQKTNEEVEELQRAERARLEKRRDEEEAHRRGGLHPAPPLRLTTTFRSSPTAYRTEFPEWYRDP
jgi:hypothetical protein